MRIRNRWKLIVQDTYGIVGIRVMLYVVHFTFGRWLPHFPLFEPLLIWWKYAYNVLPFLLNLDYVVKWCTKQVNLLPWPFHVYREKMHMNFVWSFPRHLHKVEVCLDFVNTLKYMTSKFSIHSEHGYMLNSSFMCFGLLLS